MLASALRYNRTVIMLRTILHADMDAFYTSVEQHDNPELRGRPVVVGGRPESRGVVAAASYEARAFGVRSAMPMSRALRLCPQVVRVQPRFDRYRELSQQVFAIYRGLTPLVEPLALDEAYLDVALEELEAMQVTIAPGGVEELARWLKAEVKAQTGLTVSVGAGTNKVVAKTASGQQKPDGLVVVPPGAEAAFLAPLPVRALWGVGPKAAEALQAHSITTVADLAAADAGMLSALLGSRGAQLHEMAQGRDDRPVEPERPHVSIGVERTFAQDLADGPELRAALHRMADEVAARLTSHGMRAATVVLKLRLSDFRTMTRQRALLRATDDAETVRATAEALFEHEAQAGARYRLLGITGTKLLPADEAARGGQAQLALW